MINTGLEEEEERSGGVPGAYQQNSLVKVLEARIELVTLTLCSTLT